MDLDRPLTGWSLLQFTGMTAVSHLVLRVVSGAVSLSALISATLVGVAIVVGCAIILFIIISILEIRASKSASDAIRKTQIHKTQLDWVREMSESEKKTTEVADDGKGVEPKVEESHNNPKRIRMEEDELETCIARGDKFCLAVDVEAFGASQVSHPMTEFGYCLVNLATCKAMGGARYVLPYQPDREEEPRCMEEFWLHPDAPAARKEHVVKIRALAKEMAEKGVTVADVMNEFVADVRKFAARVDNKLFVVYDTAGFDYGFLSAYLTKHTACPSMNYIREDVVTKTSKYTTSMDVSSFALGLAKRTDAGFGTFKSACLALNVPVPKWPVEHDHNPQNDATTIGLEYAYLCCAIEKRVVVFEGKVRIKVDNGFELYNHSYDVQ